MSQQLTDSYSLKFVTICYLQKIPRKLALAYYAQNFTYYAFQKSYPLCSILCLQLLQLCHSLYIIFNDCISIVKLQAIVFYFYIMLCSSVFIFDTYYAHVKTCASFNFCTMLASLLYHKSFNKHCYIYIYIYIYI